MRKQTWNEINAKLVKAGYSNKRIFQILLKLESRKDGRYDWEDLNRAFVAAGVSNRAILLTLKKFRAIELSQVRRSAGRFASIQS